MAQTYNKMKIDIKEPVTDIITAKQNDSNSRFLDVYLYDGGVPIDLTGHEVRIYMLKADGTEVFNNGEITNATAGRCQFELTDQALGAYGKLLCEISIWYDNVQILTSPTFDIHVVKNLRTAGSIESSNEYGALVVLYQNLYESIDLMTTMVEQFGEPGEVADAASIATFWQMLEYLYGVNDAALKNASVSEVLERIGVSDGGGTLFEAVEPLNELITDTLNFAKILSIGSDVTLVLSSTEYGYLLRNEIDAPIAGLKFNNAYGELTISASLKTNHSAANANIYIMVNGVLDKILSSNGNTSYNTFSTTLTVHDGDIVTMALGSNHSSQYGYCNLITAAYNIIDGLKETDNFVVKRGM